MPERRTTFVIAFVVVAVLGLAGAWVLAPRSDADAAADLTEVTDTAEIQNLLQLSSPSMATSENYVGHKVLLISGSLTNLSSMPVRLVEVRMDFTGYDGTTILEGVYPALSLAQRPLAPGSEYRFEIAFEEVPRTWNYQVPVIQVVKVAY